MRDWSEEGINNVRVHIDANNNERYDPGENFVMTNRFGHYFLSAAESGSIRVRVDAPVGTRVTSRIGASRIVTLSPGAALVGRNWGIDRTLAASVLTRDEAVHGSALQLLARELG